MTKKINLPLNAVLEASKARRVAYTPAGPLRINRVMAIDSYKWWHVETYAKNIVGMFSYIEARTKGKDIMVPFGRQAELQKLLGTPITKEDIDEAEIFATQMIGPGGFNRKVWDHILEKYKGYMPLQIRGVPEGTPVKSGNVMLTIMCVDEFVAENIFWLASYFETAILRSEWYGTTIATNDHKSKRILKHYFELTGADLGMLAFYMHDFGGRGVPAAEVAQIGGGSHTLGYAGSDTVEGLRWVNHFYGSNMAAFSVRATEHSVQCSYQARLKIKNAGAPLSKEQIAEGDLDYLRSMIALAQAGQIISIVIDGYDVYRACEMLCTVLKDDILKSGARVVFRPDSGDMLEVLPRLLAMQEAAFGFDLTSKGFKKIRTVGVLQGDGIDIESMERVLQMLVRLGYSADSVVFGSGGALLQKVNRDTYKFAQKASAVLVADPDTGDVQWVGITKDPITDPGKQSKEGMLTLARSQMTGEYMTVRIDQGPLDSEWVDVMEDIYDSGVFYNYTTLEQARARTGLW